MLYFSVRTEQTETVQYIHRTITVSVSTVIPLNFEVGRFIKKVYIDIENVFDTAKTHSIIKKSRTTSNETKVRQFLEQKAKCRIFRDSLSFFFFSGTNTEVPGR